LGTAFVIAAYPDDSTVRVAVREGRVSVHESSASDAPVIVDAGEAVLVDEAGGIAYGNANDSADLLSWTQGAVRLHERSLRDVLRIASRWYGVSLRLADSTLSAQRLTISVGHDSLPQFIQIVAAATHSRVVRSDSSVLFYAR
jgi:ferric-dicitrate binding protein FerR (iron transport regulator)